MQKQKKWEKLVFWEMLKMEGFFFGETVKNGGIFGESVLAGVFVAKQNKNHAKTNYGKPPNFGASCLKIF